MELECVICFGRFNCRRPMSTLACAHNFHNMCINDWLKRSATCPACRTPIVIQPVRQCRFYVPVGYRLGRCVRCQKVVLAQHDRPAAAGFVCVQCAEVH